jgi:pyruvate,water dikinase
MVSGRSNNSTAEEQGEAVRLLAGATGVESALMLDQLDGMVDRVAAHQDAATSFLKADAADALAWLRGDASLAPLLDAFLAAHGHRGYRELCMRDPAWIDEPEPLIMSMQAAVGARLGKGDHKPLHSAPIDLDSLNRGLRWVLPRAHDAIRRREHTKSQLVDVAHRFKTGFRHLGNLLQAEGALPDAPNPGGMPCLSSSSWSSRKFRRESPSRWSPGPRKWSMASCTAARRPGGSWKGSHGWRIRWQRPRNCSRVKSS